MLPTKLHVNMKYVKLMVISEIRKVDVLHSSFCVKQSISYLHQSDCKYFGSFHYFTIAHFVSQL